MAEQNKTTGASPVEAASAEEEVTAAARDAQGGGDPFKIAQGWLAEAAKTEPNDPNAIALATADANGLPNVRMVLLKEIELADQRGQGGGFVFYSNFESAKGRELQENPQAALCLHWKTLGRQVRARGRIEKVADEQADAYFASRPYQSRVGAWASQQSRPLESRGTLVAQAGLVAAKYPSGPPRPPHWGGYRLVPAEMEFWSDGAFRLHDRFQWRWRESADGRAGGWEVRRLSP
ncbi:MAG: pyridoxamine 5'-phosphate oxidase [Pseudomonadota bacterium]